MGCGQPAAAPGVPWYVPGYMPCIPGLPTYGPYLLNMQTETHAYASTHVDKEGRETSARGEQGKQVQGVPTQDNKHERAK